MGRETVLLSSEEPMSAAQIAEFLHALADKIAGGTVTLRQGTDELVLDLPPNLVLEVKVEEQEKGGKKARAEGRSRLQRTIEVEIEWTEGEQSAAGIQLG
ncbi:MAG: amphi-Trp domain-containing protein [Anaerolineae bacterium]|jgi:amphi-Trp domain-containing protein